MLIFVGDSHTIALRSALSDIDADLKKKVEDKFGGLEIGQLDHGYKFLSPFYKVRDDDLGLSFADERAAEIFYTLTMKSAPNFILRGDHRTFVFCIGFHPSGSMLPKHWLQHTCSRDIVGKMYVSESAFAEYVRDYTKEVVGFYKKLQEYKVNFRVIACPPLPEGYYADEVAEVFTAKELLEYYGRFQKCFASILEGNGIEYYLPPEAVCLPSGFMQQKYASQKKAGDYHANAEYGKLMLERVLKNLLTVQNKRVSHNKSFDEPVPKAELKSVGFRLGRFCPEGIAVLLGRHCAEYKDITLILVLTENDRRIELPLAKANKTALTSELFEEEVIIYDKGWFCTYKHEGIDLTAVPDGDYKLSICITVRGDKRETDVVSKKPFKI